ncbi:uncharacterized protein TRIREDRAFT_109094 [Trichoderma reesei QM6a]|uniref:Predicted protein n=2 Tax=Hypocrea jecorina TaxID=51453 RepID=G0RNT7_HYPJQ|nr:uncharacterized protein TRIREDRAFT_109094 [Trichoderma reesei QM6a]EGR47212.1 predicted protein [Trichoderma reesei QM6a]ETS00696.1 hypothetical protein M419DRAFT_82769 [Trichoderma reesei RUT C-30]
MVDLSRSRRATTTNGNSGPDSTRKDVESVAQVVVRVARGTNRRNWTIQTRETKAAFVCLSIASGGASFEQEWDSHARASSPGETPSPIDDVIPRFSSAKTFNMEAKKERHSPHLPINQTRAFPPWAQSPIITTFSKRIQTPKSLAQSKAH